MAAKTVIRKPEPRQRTRADVDQEREEANFLADGPTIRWWAGIVADPRFQRIRRAVERRRALRGRIQASPHAQHVADGYRQGYADAVGALEGLAYSTITSRSFDGGAELEQAQNPELEDGRPDTASSRFSS